MTGTEQSRERARKAVEMKIKGLTYSEIGKALGVSRQRAQQLVRPPRIIYNTIRAKAKGKCQGCGVKLMNGHIHHKNYTNGLEDLSNLEYLCVSCHRIKDLQ